MREIQFLFFLLGAIWFLIGIVQTVVGELRALNAKDQ